MGRIVTVGMSDFGILVKALPHPFVEVWDLEVFGGGDRQPLYKRGRLWKFIR